MKSSSVSRGKTSGTRSYSLRTGKIKTTKASASAIRRSLGVTPSEAKVAAKVVLATRSAKEGRPRGASKTVKPRGTNPKRDSSSRSKKR
jgi:hypothetical protein